MRKNEDEEEISGGTEAPENAFPWIVRLVNGCPSKGRCQKHLKKGVCKTRQMM